MRRSHPRPVLTVLPLLAGLLLAGPAPAEAQPLRERPGVRGEADRAERVLRLLGPEHLLREAWRVTRDHFYDRSLNGVDWDAALARHLPRVATAATPEQVYAVVNAMLGELKTSHLVLIGRGVWQRELAQEFTGRPAARPGFELVDHDGRLFVDGLVEGGPGEAAGLLEGDEVVTIEGLPAHDSPLLEGAGHDPGLPGRHGYSLRVADGVEVALTARRRAGQAPRPVTLRPFPRTLIEASRSSARVVEVAGETADAAPTRVGVIHLWHFISEDIVRLTARALRGKLADADALVLDVRGRGGSAAVVSAILGMFDGRRPLWTKPVVCLTDGGTRSAKEIFAWHWKRRGLGPVIGETTQGACIGCGFRELSDGSVLALPLQDVRRLTRGTSLEGVGVAPTVAVPDAPLPFRAGADPILAAGLEAAASAVRGARRAKRAVPF